MNTSHKGVLAAASLEKSEIVAEAMADKEQWLSNFKTQPEQADASLKDFEPQTNIPKEGWAQSQPKGEDTCRNNDFI